MNKAAALTLTALRINPVFIDNHTNIDGRKAKKVVSFVKDGNEYLINLLDREETPYFCVNPILLENDGRVHLQRASVGPTLDLAKHGSVEQAIAHHNKWSTEFTKWDNGLFGNVITL